MVLKDNNGDKNFGKSRAEIHTNDTLVSAGETVIVSEDENGVVVGPIQIDGTLEVNGVLKVL